MTAQDDHPDSIRRRILQAGAGAAALGALPGTAVFDVAAQPPFDWKRFKGEKIEVFHVKSPRGDLLTRLTRSSRISPASRWARSRFPSSSNANAW